MIISIIPKKTYIFLNIRGKKCDQKSNGVNILLVDTALNPS